MPELPEVETVCRGLRPILEGQRIKQVIQRREDLRFPLPKNFVQRLTGRTVLKIDRRGKYILIHLDNDWTLIGHLGMSGRISVIEGKMPKTNRHDHIEFLTDAGANIRYNDPRRFGFMELIETDNLFTHRYFANLGPEPLSNEFNGKILSQSLKNKSTSLKTALLDQRIVAGLGNIYVCEALCYAALSPLRNAQTIFGQRAERLTTAIRDVLIAAIAAGGSSLRDYTQTNGELGYFQNNWRVYGRDGRPCVINGCKGTIRRIKQTGRSTFYCSKHQR